MKTVINKKKDLGQYFTPLVVVQFMYEMVKILQGGRFRNRPRIIDPACGEGVFLHYALGNNISDTDKLFGIDKDPAIEKKWEENGLKELLDRHLYIQNGLVDTNDQRVTKDPNKIIRQFDLVIGNPPFGGIGVSDLVSDWKLRNALTHYDTWLKQFRLPAQNLELQLGRKHTLGIDPKLVRRIEKFPIEILFVERFLQLGKPGGQIAIILPDGFFSNESSQTIRDWALTKGYVQAVIGLPRRVFASIGANAKTSILFMRKFNRGKTGAAYLRSQVFLADLSPVNDMDELKTHFGELLKSMGAKRGRKH